MRILIVEDELKTARYLRKGLSEAGLVVDLAHTGTEGLHIATSEDYDLILLDVMLPDVDGWHVLRAIRKTRDTPILFLTARDTVQDRVKGFELGADDYLTKPFAFAELLWRVRALLRRGRQHNQELVRVADLEIDVLKRQVTRSGTRIELTTKEFMLLHLLAAHAGEVLSRPNIVSQLWDMNFDSSTNIVDVMIAHLRAKIDDTSPTKLIRTVRGMGYAMDSRG